MGGRIFSLGDDGVLAPLDETPYELEDVLQRLLAEYPEILAVDQERASVAWLLVRREAGVPDEGSGASRWAVDHLFLDQEGVPTLVETKRSSDTRLRREVVGQMLDYAANAVVYWPPDEIRQQFEARCEAHGQQPEELLAEFLDGDTDVEGFWARVRTNLQAERVRMILVADEIPRETQRIIEFLNGQLDPAEVLGVEIRQYMGDGTRTLVPQVVGRTAEAEQRKAGARTRRQWDLESFEDDLAERRGEAEVSAARRIRSWAAGHGVRIAWGQGAKYGSFILKASQGGIEHSIFSISTAGEIQIHFGMMRQPPFDALDKRQELLNRLNDIPGVEVRASDLETSWPIMPLYALIDDEHRQQFLATWNWYLDQIPANEPIE